MQIHFVTSAKPYLLQTKMISSWKPFIHFFCPTFTWGRRWSIAWFDAVQSQDALMCFLTHLHQEKQCCQNRCQHFMSVSDRFPLRGPLRSLWGDACDWTQNPDCDLVLSPAGSWGKLCLLAKSTAPCWRSPCCVSTSSSHKCMHEC